MITNLTLAALTEVEIVEKETFSDYLLSKGRLEYFIKLSSTFWWSDDFQFLVENYPDLDYNISPSPDVNQPIQIDVQLALYNIISMVYDSYDIMTSYDSVMTTRMTR